MKELEKIQKEAIKEISKAIKVKPDVRGFKFGLLLVILKIAIPALISILKALDAEKYKDVIKILEKALSVIDSI